MDACVEPLRRAGKLGPLLWQLPPHPPRRRRPRPCARDADARPPRLRVPGRELVSEDVYELLRAHGAALVVADRAPGEPSPWVDTAGWTYLRFHSGRERDGNYASAELRAWADRVASQPGDVFAYFNNDWQGFAIAARRCSLLRRAPSPAKTPSSSSASPAPRDPPPAPSAPSADRPARAASARSRRSPRARSRERTPPAEEEDREEERLGRLVEHDELLLRLRMRPVEDSGELLVVVGREAVEPEVIAALDVRLALRDLLRRDSRRRKHLHQVRAREVLERPYKRPDEPRTSR